VAIVFQPSGKPIKSGAGVRGTGFEEINEMRCKQVPSIARAQYDAARVRFRFGSTLTGKKIKKNKTSLEFK
jgi:hypothetical protein